MPPQGEKGPHKKNKGPHNKRKTPIRRKKATNKKKKALHMGNFVKRFYSAYSCPLPLRAPMSIEKRKVLVYSRSMYYL